MGRVVGRIEGALGAGVTYHRWLWLVHVLCVYALLFCFPFTKLRHLIFGPLNLFFRNMGPRGRLAPIKDFENAETFGVSQVEQYTWKQLLDMGSCLECGRCTINCPTVNTGKTLNPKFLVIEQREHLLDKAPFLLAAKANASNGDDAAAEAPAWNGPDMITQVATEEAVWGCTTCGWCEEGCPVGIEHIQRIVDMRRYDVLMESRFPTELTGAFKGIENQGNPWGLAQEKRAEWANGLEIPEMAELEDPSEIDVLYWVGCAGSYDERNQRVSKSFSGLMKQAGVKFAILGREETCTGDPARRLGNEYLYATVAAQNVETLNRYKPRRIVTQCPHCFHNLKNEYPGLRRQLHGPARSRVYRRADPGRAPEAARQDQRAHHLSRPVLHGAPQSQMGQRSQRARRDSRRRGRGGRAVEESHVLLRRGRRMLLEGGARGHAHQSEALRSAAARPSPSASPSDARSA